MNKTLSKRFWVALSIFGATLFACLIFDLSINAFVFTKEKANWKNQPDTENIASPSNIDWN